jgi:hypothetical protein
MALALPVKRGDARGSEHTDMIVCARCGAANEPSSKFCPSCGASLSIAGTKASEAGNPAPLPPLPPLGPSAPLAAPNFGPPGPPAPGLGIPPLGSPAPALGQSPFWASPPGPNPPPALQGAPTGAAQAFGAAEEENARHRIGAPEGLNPFSATVSPQSLAADGISPFSPFVPHSPVAPVVAVAPLEPLPPLPPPQAAPGFQAPGFGAPPAPAFGSPASPNAGFASPPPAFAAPNSPNPFGPPAGAHSSPAFGSPGFAPAAPASAYGDLPPAPAYGERSPAAYADPAPAYGERESSSAGYGQRSSPVFAPPPPQAPAEPANFPPPQPYLAPSPSAAHLPPAAALPRLDQPTAEVRAAAASGRDPEAVEPGAPHVLAGFLVSFEYELGLFWPLYQGTNVVGRRDAAPGLDVQIDHPTTSSRHAIIYASARPGRLKVEDAGSTNGTQLGDIPLERGKKYELRDGDTIRFGGYSLIVKLV